MFKAVLWLLLGLSFSLRSEAKFCTDVLVALQKKQARVQNDKMRARTAEAYINYLLRPSYSSHYHNYQVDQYLRNLTGVPSDQDLTLEQVLRALKEREKRPIEWVDLGAGLALPMREVLRQWPTGDLNATAVDLFDWQRKRSMTTTRGEVREVLGRDIFSVKYRPTLVQGDIQNVKLDVAPDIVTSVESIQYVDNKLETIVNWYNQLADNGLLIITAEHQWASWIVFKEREYREENLVMFRFLNVLRKKGIQVYINESAKSGTDIKLTSLLIVKKPRTKLELLTQVSETRTNPYGYVLTLYSTVSALLKVERIPKSK